VPRNLQLHVQDPSGNTRPQITVTWENPVAENGIITKYTLVYSYTFEGQKTSSGHSTNGQTFSYSFDVLGGMQYTVEIGAETIKPGPKTTSSKQVPVYSKYGFHVSIVLVVMVVAVVVAVITLFLGIGKKTVVRFFQAIARRGKAKLKQK